jgi:hypothetical protein
VEGGGWQVVRAQLSIPPLIDRHSIHILAAVFSSAHRARHVTQQLQCHHKKSTPAATTDIESGIRSASQVHRAARGRHAKIADSARWPVHTR